MEVKSTVTYDDCAKLDLRIGTITSADHHPNADRLLRVMVDLGSEQRQICAGIKQYYEDPSVLVGKQIVVIVNLEPRTIRGEVSNGMLLAASNSDGDEIRHVVVLGPDRSVNPGSSIS